ncbi:MAG TPA: hypothetical protein VJN93_07540 [Candidatus Acidoferrum sp.]|nr:hypothetical protein [Candidatus Acidoferrum sp.]
MNLSRRFSDSRKQNARQILSEGRDSCGRLICGERAALGEDCVAQKLCKPHQLIEESEVSWRSLPIFHTLINTSVEILISQKYFFRSSARHLLLAAHFDRSGTSMLQFFVGSSDE